MSAAALKAALEAAGINVQESRSDWATNGGSWAVGGKPEGVMIHHTAPPVPYPVNKLDGSSDSRIKCNINTKPDGTLYLCAYEACNYSSGSGAGKILTDYVRKSIAPTANGMFPDSQGGNAHFWNYENDHPGDGSPIPEVQLDVINLSVEVVIDHFGLDPEQVISHAEWSRRKIDPNWAPGGTRSIENIRAAVAGGGDMGIKHEDIYKKWGAGDIQTMHDKGLFGGSVSYYTDDIGTYAHKSDWENLTVVVLAADAALPQSSGGAPAPHDHDGEYTKPSHTHDYEGHTEDAS